MFRIPQGSGFGIDCMLLLACIGISQDPQSLSIGRHHSVLDPVVDHLDEMTGAVRTAMQVTHLSRPTDLFASRRANNLATAWGQSRENGIKPSDGFGFSTNH